MSRSQGPAPLPAMARLCLRAFGAGIRIETNDAALLDELRPHLPPRCERADDPVAGEALELHVADRTYTLVRGTETVLTTADRNRAVLALASEIHLQVALQAETALFVHAGVVGWSGRAVVI